MKKYPRFNLYLSDEVKAMLRWLAYDEGRAHPLATRRPSPSTVVERLVRAEYEQRAGPDLDNLDADAPGELAA